MITKFEKYNESIKSLLVGPTKEEMWSKLLNGRLKGLITSIPESPEDFFNQMKEGCVEIVKGWYGIYFGKNGIKLFQQDLKNGWLYVSYLYIWSVYEKIYGFNKNEIQELIEKELLKDTKWKGLTPSIYDEDEDDDTQIFDDK